MLTLYLCFHSLSEFFGKNYEWAYSLLCSFFQTEISRWVLWLWLVICLIQQCQWEKEAEQKRDYERKRNDAGATPTFRRENQPKIRFSKGAAGRNQVRSTRDRWR